MSKGSALTTKPPEPWSPLGWAQDQILNGPVGRLCSRSPALKRVANHLLVDQAITRLPPRPYAFSTKTRYTSWESLTDRTFCARELRPTAAARRLPAAEDLLELFRRDEFVASDKSTMLFAYVAQWFTDGFLRSPRLDQDGNLLKPRDLRRNDSTNHVDLAQVYGVNEDITKSFRDGRHLACQTIDGEQYPPALFEADGSRVERFKDLPVIGVNDPKADRTEFLAMGSDAANTQIGYAMLNTLFLRAHNTVADLIADREPGLSDEQIFDVTRNVLIVLTIKLVIEEYINHITPWRFQFGFDPTRFERARWHRQNWVAVEFNLLYRWHCLIPPALVVHGEALPPQETMFRTRTLLTRQRGLGELLHDASWQPCGAIQLFNTGPELLTSAELPTIEAARDVGVGSYNEYRRHCGFRPITRFDDISSDERVVRTLKQLYRDVDDIEFYPGLYAEDRPPNSVVQPLMGRMVAAHAFSQLYTNPLLAPALYNPATFTKTGFDLIRSTTSIQQMADRVGLKGYDVRLTHADWTRKP